MFDDDDEGGAAREKLIPEWRVAADDQVLFAGLAVVGIMAVLLGWNAWRGGDDSDIAAPLAPVIEQASSSDDDATASGGDADGNAAAAVTTTTVATTTTEATTATTAASTTTTAPPAPTIGDVQAAVDPLAGDITAATDGSVATLTGFVANAGESAEAETEARGVEGITDVVNDLELLEPAVLAALQGEDVVGATATGEGTVIRVGGTIGSEADRATTLAAALEVPGVGEVIDDRLEVSVTEALNDLPQVQFETNSAVILPASFEDLDAMAELLGGAGDVSIQVQGYTDVVGDAARNQTLSENRAEAVRSYLVEAGVDADILTTQGFGETEDFGDDLASNRLVRFEQLDS